MTSEFEKLCHLMEKLRSQDGCGWDRKQTLTSLKKYLVEETYETIDAINALEQSPTQAHVNEHCEELGDLLLQIVFQSQIQKENDAFTIADVCKSISEKLIRRHPHIFGAEQSFDPESNPHWEKIKETERQNKGIVRQSALDGIPKSMPTFDRLVILDKKARDGGFDWPDKLSSFEKLLEEVRELSEVIHTDNKEKIAHELGDVITSCISLARHAQLDIDSILLKSEHRFESRFRKMEELIRKDGAETKSLSLHELEDYWQMAKLVIE